MPRTVKEAEELARAYLRKSEYTLIEATGSCVGDPDLKAKTLIEIAGVGQRYSGAYYVARVTHIWCPIRCPSENETDLWRGEPE